MKLLRWFTDPKSPNVIKQNFINVQIDAVGVGFIAAAAPFMPVFLTRLGANSLMVSLLTIMPAITGFLLAIFFGRILQRQKNIIPWFSTARLAVIFAYTLTGIITFFIPENKLIAPILIIWAFATLPQTILAITFTVVMNAIAGPSGRFELMTRRWTVLGITTGVTIFLVGQFLDLIVFPLNYQLMLILLSAGGLISYIFSRRIVIEPSPIPPPVITHNILDSVKEYFYLIKNEKPFISFASKRLIFLLGFSMTIPLLPMYFVRVVDASDSWIAAINTTKTIIMVFGYFFWSNLQGHKGSKPVLLLSTFGVAIYPILVGASTNVWTILLLAAVLGIFQSGLDLVFFEELMKTIPLAYSPTFVSFAQSIQFLSSIIAPFLASFVADNFGLSHALILAGIIQFTGFILFASQYLHLPIFKHKKSIQ